MGSLKAIQAEVNFARTDEQTHVLAHILIIGVNCLIYQAVQ